MQNRFGNSKLNSILKNPVPQDSGRKNEGAPVYDEVYNLFIEGKFDEALSKKHQADSLYGKHYWSPQLLYIEAVYQVHQRNDSAAIIVLNNINNLYPGTPMAAKAKTMIDVLGRRKQIEDYLTKLQIEIPPDDSVVATTVGTPMTQGPAVLNPAAKPLFVSCSSDHSDRRLHFGMVINHQHAVRRQVVVAHDVIAGHEVVHRLVELDAHL